MDHKSNCGERTREKLKKCGGRFVGPTVAQHRNVKIATNQRHTTEIADPKPNQVQWHTSSYIMNIRRSAASPVALAEPSIRSHISCYSCIRSAANITATICTTIKCIYTKNVVSCHTFSTAGPDWVQCQRPCKNRMNFTRYAVFVSFRFCIPLTCSVRHCWSRRALNLMQFLFYFYYY